MTMGPPRPRTRSSLSPVQRGVTNTSIGPRRRTRSSLSPAQRGVTNGSVASPPPLFSPQLGSSRKRKVSTVTTVSKKTSWVWAHFDDITDEEGKRWSKCKHCEGGRYRCGGKDYGTGNMNYHLRRCSEYLKTKSGPGSELDNMGKEMEQVGVGFSQNACRKYFVCILEGIL
ncbi:hypothetical protein MKW94_029379 [Papaver nudicaule]|uniref:BED-type domain-containing protein n=1 Tax=Papaver nudicaule TaxID=74823 RepID=A0AA41VZK6_PAPNU|nr:hypothetical protein [Papaver nudicaule]